MKIRVCTLCSGYDSQMLAMKRIEKDFGLRSELVAWSEIDKIAIKAHDALFPESTNKNLGDMTKIDWSKVVDFDLLTYSTPCTSISTQGKREGLKKGSGTESSILWHTENCIKIKRPKYLLLENVKALTSKRHEKEFKAWLDLLEGYGYVNYWKVLDSADYGIPQHRERVFVVSVLKEQNKGYEFPKPIKLKTFAKDLLEPIDRKWLYNSKYLSNYHDYELSERYKKGTLRCIGNVLKSNHNSGKVWVATENTIVPTCMAHHGTSVILRRFDDNGNHIICKMSPKEMFKFMGVEMSDINRIEKVCGSSGLFKLAGNSIVVDVLYHIFRKMFV